MASRPVFFWILAFGACGSPPATAPASPGADPDAACSYASCSECLEHAACTFDVSGAVCIVRDTRCNARPCLWPDEVASCRRFDALVGDP
ncbi:MAG: hypothetical protein IT373_36345 [Polyangiaceae bacterium]|nr:hypothetical protein [Polyangiaceae bacterium]